MLWFVLCLVGIIGNIANWAHSIGLAVGIVIGIAPYAWRQSTKFIAAKLPRDQGKD
jgi:hypothetical protein